MCVNYMHVVLHMHCAVSTLYMLCVLCMHGTPYMRAQNSSSSSCEYRINQDNSPQVSDFGGKFEGREQLDCCQALPTNVTDTELNREADGCREIVMEIELNFLGYQRTQGPKSGKIRQFSVWAAWTTQQPRGIRIRATISRPEGTACRFRNPLTHPAGACMRTAAHAVFRSQNTFLRG